MDELEEMMLLEEEAVRVPRKIDDILTDLRQAKGGEQIRRLEDELFHRVTVQFGLEDEESAAVAKGLSRAAKRSR